MDCDNRALELKSAEDLHRFEASIMLGQTAVYLVASGTLLNAIVGKQVPITVLIAVCIFGVLLSGVFLLIANPDILT